MKRRHVSKRGSKRLFRVTGDNVHPKNLASGLSRGGIRL